MTQGGDRPGAPSGRRGLLITFEGGDGAGKTTQIERVRAFLADAGHDVLVTREPGGTELGVDLRRLIQHGPEDVDPVTEALLYAADRSYHVTTVVRPAMEAGAIVLGDRFVDSSLAYQGAARSLGVDEVRGLSEWATRGLDPDLTFLLDLPPEVGARRVTGTPDRLERESTDFHERVRHEYLHLAELDPDRIVVIDAVGTPDQVFSEIRGVLEERLPELLARLSPAGSRGGSGRAVAGGAGSTVGAGGSGATAGSGDASGVAVAGGAGSTVGAGPADGSRAADGSRVADGPGAGDGPGTGGERVPADGPAAPSGGTPAPGRLTEAQGALWETGQDTLL